MDLGRDRNVWELIGGPLEQRPPKTGEFGLPHEFVLITGRSMLEHVGCIEECPFSQDG